MVEPINLEALTGGSAGPWRVEREDYDGHYILCIVATDREGNSAVVARTSSIPSGDMPLFASVDLFAGVRANATLLAAAPALRDELAARRQQLAALGAMLEGYDRHDCNYLAVMKHRRQVMVTLTEVA